MTAALFTLNSDRPALPQKLKGHPPRGVVCLQKARRLRWEKDAAGRRRAEELSRIRDTLQSLQAARLRALTDLAQPDSVLAARVRQQAAQVLEDTNTQILGFERRLREL